MKKTDQLQTVILVGGRGTRLGSLTEQIPKPMMEIDGRPFLEFLLIYLREQGLKRFLLIVGYLPDYIPAYFGDGSSLGVEIEYAGDVKNLSVGTGGAIKRAADKLDEHFLLLFGDTLLPLDYADLISRAQEFGCQGLLTVYDNQEETDVINNITLNAEGLVEKYLKNSQLRLDYVDAGVGLFAKEILSLIPEGEVSFEEEVYPKLIAEKELAAYPTSQRFFDIGTPQRLENFKNYYYDHLAHAG